MAISLKHESPPAPPGDIRSKAVLSVWLNSYDDIFSDFDPRPFNERVLSDDFITEAKKIAREKPDGKIEFKLLIPEKLRDAGAEAVIVKSLHAHFRRFARAIEIEKRKTGRMGLLLALGGFSLLSLATWIANLPVRSFFHNTSLVIIEPAGWFLAWTGLDQLFYASRKRKPELAFNDRMAHADIVFLSY
jgi:hypothetical protein